MAAWHQPQGLSKPQPQNWPRCKNFTCRQPTHCTHVSTQQQQQTPKQPCKSCRDCRCCRCCCQLVWSTPRPHQAPQLSSSHTDTQTHDKLSVAATQDTPTQCGLAGSTRNPLSPRDNPDLTAPKTPNHCTQNPTHPPTIPPAVENQMLCDPQSKNLCGWCGVVQHTNPRWG